MKMRMTYQVSIIEKREYVLLKRLISLSNFHFDGRKPSQVRKLSDLLKSAKILDEEEMPEDIVRLHTTVTVSQFEDEETSFQIVLPDAVSSEFHQESILSPIGVACFGFSLGTNVQVTSADSTKSYTICKVKQSNKAKNSISVNQEHDQQGV